MDVGPQYGYLDRRRIPRSVPLYRGVRACLWHAVTVATPARNLELPPDVAADVERAASAGERVTLTHDGAPVAAVVSLDDLRVLEAIEAEEDRLDVEEAERVMAEARARGEEPVPWEQVKRDLGL